jgi:hypothetical protein
VVGEHDAFGQQADEPDGDLYDHDHEGHPRLAAQRLRDVVERERDRQGGADGERGDADHQVQANAASDRLVHRARIAFGDVLAEVTDARHRHTEREQAHVPGHRGNQGPRAVPVLTELADTNGVIT